MKASKIIFFLILVTALFLTSCKEDSSNPTEPENGNGGTSGTSNPSGQPVPNMAGDSDGVLATINYEFETMPGFPAAALNMAFAQFGQGVDGGSVSVNSNTVGKTSQGGTTFYISPSPSNPTATLNGVNFDGSNHNWSVSGNGEVPAINGSVASPRNFSLTVPANNASVSKSGDLTITWNNSSSSSKVLVVLAAINNSGQYYAAEELNDTGSFTIAASDMSGFSGDCMLQVVKYNYSSVSAGGKNYYLISEIVKSVTLKVN